MTDRTESNDNEPPDPDAEPDLPPLGDLPPDDVPAPEAAADETTEIPPPPSPPGYTGETAAGGEPPVPPSESTVTPPGAAAAPSPGMTPPSAAPAQPGTPPPAAPTQSGTSQPGMTPPPAAPMQPGMTQPGAPQPGMTPPGAAPTGMGAAAPGAGAAAAPGWYPAPGGQRYWDGQQWTEHAVAGAANPTSEYSTAMWAHLAPLLILVLSCGVLFFVAFVAPLVMMNGQGKQSAYVRHHSTESLNFQLTLLIYWVVSIPLTFMTFGLFSLVSMVVGIVAIVFMIMASVAANRGEWYRYPVNIRFVK